MYRSTQTDNKCPHLQVHRNRCVDRYVDMHGNIPLQGDAEHRPHHAADGKFPLMNVGGYGLAVEGVLERNVEL